MAELQQMGPALDSFLNPALHHHRMDGKVLPSILVLPPLPVKFNTITF